MRGATILATALLPLGACSLAPTYVRPAPPVPPSWPTGDAYLRRSEAALPAVTYRDIFRDERLQRVIDQALANNRDLRIAAANIRAARAQYRIQRADLFPQVSGGVSYTYRRSGVPTTNRGTTAPDPGTGTQPGGGGNTGGGGSTSGGFSGSSYNADVGLTGFEIDLFGRIRSLTRAALDRYFAQEAAARATRLALVGDVAAAWLTYASDRSLFKVAEDTAISAQRSVRLTRARLEGGVAPRSDLRQAEQILATAETDIARLKAQLAQDVNALQLLVGAPVEAALLPASIERAARDVAELPAGLDSRVLLRRPDVVQAEYELRAANAEIGAARAQLFPTISLTGLVGFASNALSALFTDGGFNYSVTPSADYPIFRAGAARAAVEQTRAQRDAALAAYERAIQTAFREVADALARRGTITDQAAATQRFADAALDSFRLADARYRGGTDTYLASLDAQRQLYAAQQQLVQVRLERATNLVTLYRTLGGDSALDAAADGPVALSPVAAPPAAR